MKHLSNISFILLFLTVVLNGCIVPRDLRKDVTPVKTAIADYISHPLQANMVEDAKGADAVKLLIIDTIPNHVVICFLPEHSLDSCNCLSIESAIPQLGKYVDTRYFPTCYYEHKGVLFIWTDFSVPFSQDMLDKLIEYGLTVDRDTEGYLCGGERKVWMYYVCRNNPHIYKKKRQRVFRDIHLKCPCHKTSGK